MFYQRNNAKKEKKLQQSKCWILPLGSELKKQTDIVWKKYQGLNKVNEFGNKIQRNKAQYNLGRGTAKISTLLSGGIGK